MSDCFILPGANPFLDAGEVAFFRSWGQAGRDGIQIHINHAGSNRGLVEQGLTFESGFPESALDVIFFISGSGDEFVEAAHKPAEAAVILELFLRPLSQWHIMGGIAAENIQPLDIEPMTVGGQ